MTDTRDNVAQDLRRIADEIRVKIHLAGMDAKDAWAKLEPKVVDFEHKLERATADAAEDLDDLADVLRRELQRLKDKVFGS